MNYVEFLTDVFLPNIWLYIISLATSFTVMYFIGRKNIFSIFDPLTYILMMSGFANAIPLFLYLTNNCSLEHFSFFCAAEGAFWCGFMLLYNKDMPFNNEGMYNTFRAAKFMFHFSFLLYVSIHLLTYAKFGVPLFMTNRNDTFRNSGGWGVLSYLNGFAFYYILMYLYDQIHRKRIRKSIIFIGITFAFTFLDGSKSGIMHFAFAYIVYYYFYLKKEITIKKKYLIIILAFPVFSIFANSGGSIGESALGVAQRFMYNGDCYIMAYPDKSIDRIKIEHPVLYTLSPLLRALRIVSYPKDSAEPIGIRLVYDVVPNAEYYGVTTSPNTRPPLLVWVCFNWGGILFTFLYGMLIAWCMSGARNKFNHNIYGLAWFFFIYEMGNSGVTDPFMFFADVFALILNYILFNSVLALFMSNKRHKLLKA